MLFSGDDAKHGVTFNTLEICIRFIAGEGLNSWQPLWVRIYQSGNGFCFDFDLLLSISTKNE